MVEVPGMVMKTVINIQEVKIATTEVAEWVLDITAAPIMDTVVTVDATNRQEADMEIADQIGDPDLVVLVAETGELVAMKVVTAIADIPKISI